MAPKDKRSDKSLRYSIRDGVFASMMTGFTADYFTPFLLVLGGTVKHVGILNALPNLFASIIQLKSPAFTEKFKSRKKVIDIFVLLQALLMLPMAISFLFGSFRVAVFIAIVTLFTSVGAVVAPAWGSLMADLVRDDKRGEYFGWRSRILGFVNIGASCAAGFILHETESKLLFWGFTIVFGLALVFRLISWYYLKKMHEPKLEHREEDYFSIFDFVAHAKTSNFARFVFFVAVTKFCVNIASPFFAVFMLRDLKFGYLTYTLITLAATLAMNFSVKRWGMHADKIGNLKVVKLTSKLVAFIPLLWLVNQNPYFLFFAQAFSGFAWAGFNLSASNFIYDSTTPGKRTRCISYFNFFNGVSLCLGALIGGYLAQKLPAGYFGYSLLNLILISALLRLGVAFLLPFNLKEVRDVEKIKSHELIFSMFRIKPALEGADSSRIKD